MRDTVVTASSAQRQHLIQGYDASFARTPSWDWDADAGDGSLKSTASDMLTYLDANLHPKKYAADAAPGSSAATLPAAVVLDHESRTDGGPGTQQALAWGINLANHTLNDMGGTYGYESFARLNPHQDWAVIVLYNRGLSGDPRFVEFLDRVTENLSALLGSGEPATALDFMCEADKRGLARLGIQ
jgi:serine-type D-Ala-D-Ala carboxypeptidase/endopeptidase